MNSYEFEARVAELKRRAHGRWTEILRSLGIDEKILNKRNQPCPLCGGTDRFQYTDKYGEGNYYCRGCGPGGGIKLLQGIQGWSFATVLRHIEQRVGDVKPLRRPSNEPSTDRMKTLAQRLWDQAKAIAAGDEVDRYLSNRGLSLTKYPEALRSHPALGYYEKDATGKSQKIVEYPAMLARVQGADGQTITLHRTYLENGQKAPQREARKVLSAGINGAAVRLFEPTEELAIAEGIETALAIHLSTGRPVWAALNAGNMEKLWLPETVRRISIYADNDANGEYDGQACAFVLARRLKKEREKKSRTRVEVFVPSRPGSDWADVRRSRIEQVGAAA